MSVPVLVPVLLPVPVYALVRGVALYLFGRALAPNDGKKMVESEEKSDFSKISVVP